MIAGGFTSLFAPTKGTCPFCKEKGRVVVRKWESDNGAYEDHQFFCNACQKEWWVDGPDA